MNLIKSSNPSSFPSYNEYQNTKYSPNPYYGQRTQAEYQQQQQQQHLQQSQQFHQSQQPQIQQTGNNLNAQNNPYYNTKKGLSLNYQYDAYRR